MDQNKRSLLLAYLDANGFNSFQETDEGLKAYTPEKQFDKKRLTTLQQQLKDSVPFTYTIHHIPTKNWNKRWEKNFSPIRVNDFCYIRAPFHDSTTDYTYEIIIHPQQSFGTGHHESTRLTIKSMKQCEEEYQIFPNSSILDAGAGTGILSILARKMEAREIVAVDNNEWAYSNAKSNIERNQVNNIQLLHADIFSEDFFNKFNQNVKFDIALANINKSHILSLITIIGPFLTDIGVLIVSGFYTREVPSIIKKARDHQFTHIHTLTEKNWASIAFKKHQ